MRFVFLTLLLVGCTSVALPDDKVNNSILDRSRNSIDVIQNEDGSNQIINHGSGYSLAIPSQFYIWGSKKFFSTVPPPKEGETSIYSDLLTLSDSDVRIMHLSDPCTPKKTGASKANIARENISWGRVNFFDDLAFMNEADEDLPVCRPPKLIKREIYPPDGVQEPLDLSTNVAYVLCADKADKHVLICIQQQTNNPTLAQQIFETFRWTDAD